MLGCIKGKVLKGIEGSFVHVTTSSVFANQNLSGGRGNKLLDDRGQLCNLEQGSNQARPLPSQRTGRLELSPKLSAFQRVCSQVLEETVQVDRRFISQRAGK